MSININHTRNTIVASESDLVLNAQANVSVSAKRVINVQDPIDDQDAVTKAYLEQTVQNLTGGTSGIDFAYINSILNKLTPQTPPVIDNRSLSLSGATIYRITDFTQTDNTSTGLSATPGETVNSVLRNNDFITNTLTQIGPGDSGTLEVIRNGISTASVSFDDNANNGTYTDIDSLIISNNVDYGTITGDALGFSQCYDVRAQGINTVAEGWNNIKLVQDEVETNTVIWYSDQSNPGNPEVTNITVQPSEIQHIIYSSTIPHYTSSQTFDVSFDVANLSGDFYPVTDKFFDANSSVPSTSGLTVLTDLTYQNVGITTPLPRNYLTDGSTYTVNTTVNVKVGTGIGLSDSGPTATLTNSYGTNTIEFEPGRKILYMVDNQTGVIDETNIIVENVGFGSNNARRLETVNGDTPSDTLFIDFNGETSILNDWDAAVVGGDCTHDTTDYSIGYYPEGPNLNIIGRTASQYFEVAFNRSAVSKFAIEWSGRVSGCWVKLPGTQIDSTSTLNGWLDATIPYEGSGVPGGNISNGGNGTNGCGLGSILTAGSTVNNQTVNITFGTESSSNASDNLIIIRFKLDDGDSVTSLKFKTAT